MKPITTKLFSILIHLIAGLIAVTVVLFFQDWFGSGDTGSYVFWTIPLAFGIAFSGQAILQLISNQNLLIRFLIIIFISVAISFGWLYVAYAVLGPWINAFSIPVFYLWILGCIVQLLFLDWKLPEELIVWTLKKKMTLFLGLPVVIVISLAVPLSLSAFFSYWNKPEPKTYLIPVDFRGEIKIIHGEECGIEPPNEDGRMILRIPDSGFLIIKPELRSGRIDHEYYFVDNKGLKAKPEELDSATKGVAQNLIVGVVGSGVYGGAIPNGGSSTKSPLAVHYIKLYVYQDSIPTEKYKERSRRDSTFRATVGECRLTKN
ncbi:MAG: hypothetical protein ACI9RM_001087 [Ulvibacter sp.]|jgi:hypothetical protein